MIARTSHRILLAVATLATLVACLDLPVAPEAAVTVLGGVRCAPDDAFEENDTPASAAVVSVGILRAVTCRTPGDTAEDVDFYSLRGTADSGYRAWLDASPLAVGKELRLFDAVSGDPVVTEMDGNLRMPKSGRLLAAVRLCCVKTGDSLSYSLLLSDRLNRAPIAAFDWTPTRPVIGRAVTVTSTAADPDGDSLSVRRWTLGDGRAATGVTVQTSWPVRGRYTITHVVVDRWGRGDTLRREITIDPDVARIDVTPASSALGALNDTLVLAAVARDPVGAAVADVDFTWRSSDSTVATVSTAGVVVARANGTAQVSATAFERTGTATVTVRQKVARVVLTPTSLSFGALGRSATIAARVEDARGSVVAAIAPTWTSSDADVASVNASGVVTARARGTATITASVPASSGTASGGPVSARVAVTVTQVPAQVLVTPSVATLSAATDSVLLGAAATDSGGTVIAGLPVVWSTADMAVATVGADGWVRPVGNGTATITATISGVGGTAAITVALAPSGGPPGAPFAVIASPDTVVFVAPYTATAVLRARVVDAGGRTVPAQTFTWSIITNSSGYNLTDLTSGNADSVRLAPPYYGVSGRGRMRVEVVSGTFADTIEVYRQGAREWLSIAAGRAHTCGTVRDDYTGMYREVYCWGDNSKGQLGRPSSLTDSPIPIRMPSDTFDISEVVAGDDYTCGLTTSSAVYCWGSNEFGQLGAATAGTCSGVSCSREAVRAAMTGLVAKVNAGKEHACTFMSQANLASPVVVYCWGRNQNGQLGRDPVLVTSSSTPTVVAGLPAIGRVTWLSAFGATTCLTVSQIRRCFGRNSSGEFGVNSTVDSWAPVTAPTNPSTLSETFLGGGDGFICAYQTTSSSESGDLLSCWGRDDLGQTGLSSGYPRQTCSGIPCITSATAPPLPRPTYLGAPLRGGLIGWAVGGRHTCVGESQPKIVCWGDNSSGQFGNGTRTSSGVPSAPITMPGSSSIYTIHAGVEHTCVYMYQEGLYCFGNGGSGRLGDGSRVDRLLPARIVDP